MMLEDPMPHHVSDILARWVVLYIAIISGEEADTLDQSAPLSQFDLDSLDAVEMAFEFEKRFAREVDPELFMNGNQTVAGLIAALQRA